MLVILVTLLLFTAVNAQKVVVTSQPGSIGMQPYRVAFREIVVKEKTARVDETVYRGYMHDFPDSPLKEQVHLKLGIFYQERGNYDEALSVFEDLEATSETKWKDEAKLHRAQVIKQKGMFDEAVKEFKKVIEETTDPRIAADGLINMGRLYTELDELSDAEQAYLRLMQEYGDSKVRDEAMIELASLKIRQGDESGAMELYGKLVETYPESELAPLAYESLSEIQLREGDLSNALQNTIHGLDVNVDPEFEANLLGRKGEILLRMGKYEDAALSYNKLLQEYGNIGFKDEALLGLAITFREQGNFDQMRIEFEDLERMIGLSEDLSFNLFEMDSVHIRINDQKPVFLATLSGARIQIPEMALPLGADLTLRSIPTPENLEVLPVVGKLYEVVSSASINAPIDISLPFEETAIRETGGSGSYKLYQYKDNQWVELPKARVDMERKLVQATLSSPGTIAIMYEKPVIISFRDIFFGFNSIELTPKAVAQLDTVVRMMKQFKDIKIEIAGHTDDIGSDDFNLDLSQKRADVIKDHLTARGVGSGRMIPRGYGERFSIASNETDEGRSRNRRTEFIVVTGGKGAVLTESAVKRKYSIQVGSFPYPTQANERKALVSRLGYPTEVVKRREGARANYLVWLGKFVEKEKAEQILSELKMEYKVYPYQLVQRW